jgi:hypothetical protein
LLFQKTIKTQDLVTKVQFVSLDEYRANGRDASNGERKQESVFQSPGRKQANDLLP